MDLPQGCLSALVCHFQPQVAADGGELTGVEALIRWEKPGGGLVQPGDFIPLAEDTGQIVPLGEWVLESACKQAQTLRDAGLMSTAAVIAVNVSVRQLVNGDLVLVVRRVLETTRVPAACLELEVTESTVMHDPKTSIQTLSALRDLGCRIAIDDFSLNYL